jgi:hypothetical protein
LIPRNAWGAAFSLLSRFGPSKDLFICSKDLFAEAMAGPVASAYQAHQEPKIDWMFRRSSSASVGFTAQLCQSLFFGQTGAV